MDSPVSTSSGLGSLQDTSKARRNIAPTRGRFWFPGGGGISFSYGVRMALEASLLPAATLLAASARVLASHLQMNRLTLDCARDEVLDAARRVKEGVAGSDVVHLVARLEKVTGVGIVELAKAAQGWGGV